MLNETYKKVLCMNELGVEHTYLPESHYFESEDGRVYSSFRFIIQGTATITTLKRELILSSGDLLYIPESIRHTTVWKGTPEIEFYNFNIISKKYDILSVAGNFDLQHIPEMSTPVVQSVFQDIFSCFQSGDKVKRIQAIGTYYQFYADVLPYLKEEVPVNYNKALIKAVDYIDSHYSEEFGMEALSAFCNMSESRLYYLFTHELGITPANYKNKVRIEQAAHLLKNTSATIAEIGNNIGFHSAVYFRKTFKSYTGMSPTDYRKTVNSIIRNNK